MAITRTATHTTRTGGTVTVLQDDTGDQGYSCTGCSTLYAKGTDADAERHANTCTK